MSTHEDEIVAQPAGKQMPEYSCHYPAGEFRWHIRSVAHSSAQPPIALLDNAHLLSYLRVFLLGISDGERSR